MVFCNSNKVSAQLARAFSDRGLSALALSGDSSESQREEAIERLESDDPDQRLDYLFSVDIFNEGVDIPRVNQIIMLRPTQSAIVFVQQLGRRLRKADLINDYTLLKFQLGRSPMMMDFVAHGSRDPYLYVKASRSYYNFVAQQEPELARSLVLTKTHMHILELFSKEIANGKRVEEAIMLQLLIAHGVVDLTEVKNSIFNGYKYVPTLQTLLSAVNHLNFLFVTKKVRPRPTNRQSSK